MACWVFLQAKRGGLKDTDAIDMLTTVLKAVLEQTKVEPEVIGREDMAMTVKGTAGPCMV